MMRSDLCGPAGKRARNDAARCYELRADTAVSRGASRPAHLQGSRTCPRTKGDRFMFRTTRVAAFVIGSLYFSAFGGAEKLLAQEWPQWRGPNRDAKASGFHAPAAWPKDLSKKWSVPVGNGVATPALVDG